MSKLSRNQEVAIIAALVEGNSIRSVERMTGCHRDSIMKLSVRVGEGCRRLHDARMRGLQVSLIEADEQWSFIGCKQKRVSDAEKRTGERGDCYVFVALDATSKAVLSYVIGKRTAENTVALAKDLRARVMNRPQITADGFTPYPDAIEAAFGADVDFATVEKTYTATPGNQAAIRYSPGKIRGVEKTIVSGDPDPAAISTSYIERFNLTTRMSSRRFTRLTNAFSKKLDNHRAAIALQFAHYNFCRWHESIRCTPAMAVGVATHPWTIVELIDAALSTVEVPPLPTPQAPTPMGMSAGKAKQSRGQRGTFKLTVIKGGRR